MSNNLIYRQFIFLGTQAENNFRPFIDCYVGGLNQQKGAYITIKKKSWLNVAVTQHNTHEASTRNAAKQNKPFVTSE